MPNPQDTYFKVLTPPYDSWERDYARASTPFTNKKLDRRRRLHEAIEYRAQNFSCPLPDGIVLDVGCADGILLEVFRMEGYPIIGVDVPKHALTGGMGFDYVTVAGLLAERQRIPILRIRGEDLFRQCLFKGMLAAINMRGSLEQILCRYMSGPSHDQHHDCNQLSWVFNLELNTMLHEMFTFIENSLYHMGECVIHCNGAANHNKFADELQKVASFHPLKQIDTYDPHNRLFRWRNE